MADTPALPPQGWYPDPSGQFAQRWWDGAGWTEHVADAAGQMGVDPVPPPLPVVQDSRQEAAVGGSATPTAARGTADARQLLATAQTVRARAGDCILAPDVRRKAARAAFETIRDRLVEEDLDAVSVNRLKETTEGRLRLGVIESAGYRSVGRVLAAGRSQLQQIPGVGPETATKAIGAARQLQRALRESVRVRIDAVGRPADNTRLLAAILSFHTAISAVRSLERELSQLDSDLDPLVAAASRGAGRLRMILSRPRTRRATQDAFDQLAGRLDRARASGLLDQLDVATRQLASEEPPTDALWADYGRRAALYNGLLVAIGEMAPDQAATEGFLPAEIAARVNDHPLDTSMLKDVSLRGYQAFGAKFALCQGRSMLGDEMGLGKTIEALAVMSHLRVDDARHFLVVCPASVLVNWTQEIRRHSHLVPWRLHGSELLGNLAAWARQGGVGVTTFQTLGQVQPPDSVDLALMVVDEAHYVKNPDAIRTGFVARWAKRTQRVLFLTGTPMENRVEEFRSLVGHLQPAVAASVRGVDGVAGAKTFRRAVAPAYLRRNQSDVLEELPDKIEVEEWVELEGDDLAAYRAAVRDGIFTAMRRAPFAPATVGGSAKLARLCEIVDEAIDNGRKVVVFSFFRDVLAAVTSALDGRALGPLTGSVAPTQRQALVDEFTGMEEPAVLVSQIEAGGVGLNMQAASVVILTEPQWKPSSEVQAIARCHRMGQIRPVDVHRLLAKDSADERMLEVLAEKRALIAEYVPSEVTLASPDAVDVSDTSTTTKAAGQVEAERRIIEIERRRLGIDSDLPAAPSP